MRATPAGGGSRLLLPSFAALPRASRPAGGGGGASSFRRSRSRPLSSRSLSRPLSRCRGGARPCTQGSSAAASAGAAPCRAGRQQPEPLSPAAKRGPSGGVGGKDLSRRSHLDAVAVIPTAPVATLINSRVPIRVRVPAPPQRGGFKPRSSSQPQAAAITRAAQSAAGGGAHLYSPRRSSARRLPLPPPPCIGGCVSRPGPPLAQRPARPADGANGRWSAPWSGGTAQPPAPLSTA